MGKGREGGREEWEGMEGGEGWEAREMGGGNGEGERKRREEGGA